MIHFNDDALARSGLTRERAAQMLRLARELTDLPNRVYPGPRPGESADEWAERTLSRPPKPEAVQPFYTKPSIDHYVRLWSRMYRGG